MKTMFFTAFYAPIIPSGIAISMFGLMMMYWVQKYNVLKRSIIKYNQGSELSQEMTEYLEFVCIIYAGSNFMFSRIIFGHASWTSIIGLLLGVVNAALPMETINTMLFKFKESEETKTYDEAFKNFDTDYERENPATKEEAVDRLNDMEVGKPPVKG
jgi:phosphate/sulfate permease